MIYPTDREAKDLIIQVGRLLYEEGLNKGTDGNISCRVDGGAHLWTTCSGSAKGFLTDADLVKTDLDGRVVEGDAKPSSELKLHLCVYRHIRWRRRRSMPIRWQPRHWLRPAWG